MTVTKVRQVVSQFGNCQQMLTVITRKSLKIIPADQQQKLVRPEIFGPHYVSVEKCVEIKGDYVEK